MKNTQKNFLTLVLVMILTSTALVSAQTSERNKNNVEFGAGASVPNFSSSPSDEVFASSGSNYFISYKREIFKGKRDWYTLDLKYAKASNAYSNLSKDIADANSSSTPALGVWNGGVDKYNLSFYTLGIGWHKPLTKNNLLFLSWSLNLGYGNFISPAETLTSSTGYVIKLNEANKSAFVASSCIGFSYAVSNMVSVNIGAEFIKSSFLIDDQKIDYNNGSQLRGAYTVGYNNLNLDAGLSFSF